MKLTLGNSLSKLDGLSIEQHRSLKKVLSYKVAGSQYTVDHTGGMRYLLAKDGTFASGLLKRVIGWLNSSKLRPQLEDNRKAPRGQPGLYKPKFEFIPYKEQLTAVSSAVKHHRGSLVMPTGSGKSITMALLVNALQLRTLIVVPNLGLKRQLTESFTKIFGKVGMRNITILNIDSSALEDATDYDCLIIDEAHHSAALTYRKLNKKAWGGIYYRFCFTATPFRGQEEEQILMETITGEVVYKLSYEEAVAAGMICPIEAYYLEVPKVGVKGNTWPTVYKELVVNHKHRNEMIQTLLDCLKGLSVLCLVKEVAHGHEFNAPFAHGENPDTHFLIDTFCKGSRSLVATTGVCGEGVDTKPCEYVILAGLGKSRPALMQAFGRVLRTYPGKVTGKVILFKDTSHKFTLSHFKAQVKVLKEEYGVIPTRLELE